MPAAMGECKPQSLHILLVDDERLSRVVVSNLLKKCGYRVTVVETGLEALGPPLGHVQLVRACACPSVLGQIIVP